VTVPFPVDLPDLLRLACGQGKMRLYTSFSAERGHQSALARTGDGWDSDTDSDCLVSMTKVLRQRFGNMLEREREKNVSSFSDTLLSHNMSEAEVAEFINRGCDCEPADDDGIGSDELEDGIAFALSRRGFDDALIWAIVDEVMERIYGAPYIGDCLHEVEMTTAGAHEPQPDNDFEALL
jgi:hypothetical protein